MVAELRLTLSMRAPTRCWTALGPVLLSLLLGGCVSGVSRPSAVPSYAIASAETASTWLGQYARAQSRAQSARATEARPGKAAAQAPTVPATTDRVDQAGFRLISDGVEALAARLALIDRAERSIDLQYYIFNGDVSGSVVAERLLAAADRGVRVRLLLDDIGARLGDTQIMRLSAHPNIEIRLFNPVTLRTRWLATISRVGEFGRINYRMHNKLMVVDNQVMITGGRNIGDEYFSFETLDFQDIDAIGIGAISAPASVSFDDYWNSYQAVPIEDISPRRVEPEDLERLRRRLVRLAGETPTLRLRAMTDGAAFPAALAADGLEWYWGTFAWIYDPAAKADPSSTHSGVPVLGPQLFAPLQDVDQELLIVSPYFIPRELGMELMEDLRARDVRVAVLTNSLATTDVLAVHSSYAPYRAPLLQQGVEIWELRPLAGQRDRPSAFAGDSLASLHAKTYVYDRRLLFIGSINLDPRSMNLNTEAGVMLEQPELARAAAAMFERWTDPAHAFRLALSDDGALGWGSDERREPEASLWRRCVSWLVGWLPIESQM